MTDRLRAAAQAALEELESCVSDKYGHRCNRCDSEIDAGGRIAGALRAALAEQDPDSSDAIEAAYLMGRRDGAEELRRNGKVVAWMLRSGTGTYLRTDAHMQALHENDDGLQRTGWIPLMPMMEKT